MHKSSVQVRGSGPKSTAPELLCQLPDGTECIFVLGVACIHCSSRHCRLQLSLQSISVSVLPHSISRFTACVRRQDTSSVEGSSVSRLLRCSD
jgi:hypothetical protein